MASDLDSSSSLGQTANLEAADRSKEVARGWVTMGVLAAASAVTGVLAAAWFYRKTLAKLRQAEENGDLGIKSSGGGFEEDF